MKPISYKIYLPQNSVKIFGNELYNALREQFPKHQISLNFNNNLYQGFITIKFPGKYKRYFGIGKRIYSYFSRNNLTIGFATKFLDFYFNQHNFAIYSKVKDTYGGREYYLNLDPKRKKIINFVLKQITKNRILEEI